MANLVLRAFLRQGEGRREKTLSLADHMIFKHPGKLGVIIAFYWGWRIKKRIQGLVSSQRIFFNIPFIFPTATAPPHLLKKLKEIHYSQLFWVFENHVICWCSSLRTRLFHGNAVSGNQNCKQTLFSFRMFLSKDSGMLWLSRVSQLGQKKNIEMKLSRWLIMWKMYVIQSFIQGVTGYQRFHSKKSCSSKLEISF